MESRIKRLAYDAVLLAIALIFSYVEFLFPALLPIPGFKLGLANLLILFVAKGISFYDAAVVSLLRVFCTALLFGTVTSFWFSFLGAVFSLAILFLCTHGHCPFSPIGISVLSAGAHQCGQILAACLLFKSTALIFTYLPVLLLIAIVTGACIGWLFLLVYPRLPSTYRKEFDYDAM